jgi:two-component system, NarL family, response regulator FusR
MNYTSAIVLDDHQLFAEAFAGLIKASEKFESVTSTNEFSKVEKELSSLQISHLFIDYMMPDVNTMAEIKRFRTKYPKLQIIVVSSIINANLVLQLQKAGANAFLSKNSNITELTSAFKQLEAGKFFMSSDLKTEVIDMQFNGKKELFTSREFEIMHHIVNGDTIDETAEKLNLSKHTVVAHRRNMMEKMEVNSVPALIKKAMDLGMMS